MLRDAAKAPRRVREDEALRLILQGTVSETGLDFFRALVQNLGEALQTYGAWVTEYLPESRRLRSIAFWLDRAYVEHYEYAIDGTPCEPVIDKKCVAHFPENIVSLFPEDPDLAPFGAVSYMGLPLLDTDGELLGHLAVMDKRPMPREPGLLEIFEIFAARATAEYRRLRAEQRMLERQEQLSLLLDSAMDAILVLDTELAVTRANPAAERVFGGTSEGLLGEDIRHLLDTESARQIEQRAGELQAGPATKRQYWFPHGLKARRQDGSGFPAEATLSCFETRQGVYHTLILRNVDERLEAEKQIRLLTDETEYLREFMHDLPGSKDLLGQSPCMKELFQSISQVAGTDATVLIQGETGTGKELIARSLHQASARSEKPLVRVNCAAIPGTLMESEFFGHEKGAFTGATSRREGRFALADGGTIFLDEVAELPLDLQAKLLRVLQEGEFETLGSTRTQKVDVRVLAATNRDLKQMVEQGRFRQDLFYRLDVFPLPVPPLRARPQDIGLLANVFAQRFARRMGRQVEPLPPDEVRRLSAYGWPGNVRELQNVVERAIILSPGVRINLGRALPGTESAAPPEAASPDDAPTARVLTAADMEALERQNFLRALKASSWKVAGEKGAAALLGLPPSTLSSRMKALGIRRPR